MSTYYLPSSVLGMITFNKCSGMLPIYSQSGDGQIFHSMENAYNIFFLNNLFMLENFKFVEHL